MKKAVYLTLFLLLSLPTSGIASEEEKKFQFKKTNFEVRGLSKIKSSYFKNILEQCFEGGDSDEKALSQCLMNSKNFSSVQVTIGKNSTKITLSEKWSLIPLPFVSVNSGDQQQAGVFVFDSNFLGYGKTAAAGFTVSTAGFSTFLHYNDPAILYTSLTGSMNLGNSIQTITHYQKTDRIDAFSENKVYFKPSLGYRFSNALRFETQLGYEILNYSQEGSFQDLQRYSYGLLGLKITFGNPKYKLYFQEGFQGYASALTQVFRSDQLPNRNEFKGQLKFQHGTFFNHAVEFVLNAGKVGGGDKRDLLRVGAQKGFRGIPRFGAWTDSYLTAGLDYQIPLKQFRVGTLTFAPFFDYGHFEFRDLKNTQAINYYSAGGGAYFFLRTVAVPGLGLQVGTNSHYNEVFGTFFIGFSQ